MVGTLYGAVTNTPGLGAANEALLSVFPNGAPSIANGYACAYPLGVVGIIGATILIKYICKVNPQEEEEQLNMEDAANPHAKAHNMHLRVENAYIAGRTLREVSEFLNRDIVCSRLLHKGEVSIPNSKTTFEVGDELLVVCAEAMQKRSRHSSALRLMQNGTVRRMRFSTLFPAALSLPVQK